MGWKKWNGMVTKNKRLAIIKIILDLKRIAWDTGIPILPSGHMLQVEQEAAATAK